jgi:hypothetical protein
MSELSPAAQEVLDAYYTYADLLNREVSHEEMLAAALRAAADQVRFHNQLGLNAYGGHAQAQNQLLAIADELEGSND